MVTHLAYQAADLATRALPRRTADALARSLARAAFAAGLPARKAAEDNLARLLPAASAPARRALARESFETFALAFADFLRLQRMRPDELVRAVQLEGAEHLQAARSSGRGVILLSAHLGNWEWGAAWLGAHGIPLHLAARPHADAGVERLFARRRSAFGLQLLPARARLTHAAALLRDGQWLALMGDRPADPGTPHGGSVCASAAALARRTGALVLPAAVVRLSATRHALVCEAPLSPDECRDGGYRAAVERWLTRCPGQWAAFEPLPEGLA
jgi:KDO2-lipid IV(A) lauroyltransferase